MENERQVTKCMAKLTWFRSKASKKGGDDEKDRGWRNKLVGSWRGEDMPQRKVKNMQFTTLLQVPNTRGGELVKQLVKTEPSLARITGYNVKIVEKAGIQLRRMFQRVFTPTTCHWSNCPACAHSSDPSGSKCRKNNVVYEAVCVECESSSASTDSGREKGAFNSPDVQVE